MKHRSLTNRELCDLVDMIIVMDPNDFESKTGNKQNELRVARTLLAVKASEGHIYASEGRLYIKDETEE